MTGQVLRFDAAAHKVVDALLPWYVNGTLEGEELEGVQRHLRECALCRQEVEWLRELYEACAVAEAAPGTPNAFRKLRSRLEARSSNHRVGGDTTWNRMGWTRWASTSTRSWCSFHRVDQTPTFDDGARSSIETGRCIPAATCSIPIRSPAACRRCAGTTSIGG